MKKANEAGFTTTVIEYATLRGWLCYHQRPAMTKQGWRSALQGHAGFPDLVLVRGERVVFAELKMPRGVISAWQEAWGNALKHSGAVEYYVWQPSDWPTIEEVLR